MLWREVATPSGSRAIEDVRTNLGRLAVPGQMRAKHGRTVEHRLASKTLACLAIALLIPAATAAGKQPATDVRQPGLEELDPTDAIRLTTQWLEQGNPRLLAWAVYWIERDDQFQRVPQLLDIVARYNSDGGNPSSFSSWTDNDAALLAVLDALICLHADVPVNEAEALYGKFPVQALVLLSRSDEDTGEALLRILDSTKSFILWLATADLLAAKPPAGFAFRLLKLISVDATIRVLDPGQGAVGEGWGGSCGSPLEDPRRNWPPVGAYRLTPRQSPGSELFAGGENPVYLIRTLSRGYSKTLTSYDCAESMRFFTLSDLSRDLIGQLLGFKREEFFLQLNPTLDLMWTTAKSYTDAATAFVREQEEMFRSTVERLEAQGLLSEPEAELARPKIGLHILDQRKEKTALPDLVSANPAIDVTYRAVDLEPAY